MFPQNVIVHGRQRSTTGRIQFKVLLSCLAKSSDFDSALLQYYVNVQVFNVLLK